jgi:hypothetical protein
MDATLATGWEFLMSRRRRVAIEPTPYKGLVQHEKNAPERKL